MLHVDHSRHAQSPGSSLPGTRVAAHGKRAAPLLARFLLTAQGAGASGLFSQPRVRDGAVLSRNFRICLILLFFHISAIKRGPHGDTCSLKYTASFPVPQIQMLLFPIFLFPKIDIVPLIINHLFPCSPEINSFVILSPSPNLYFLFSLRKASHCSPAPLILDIRSLVSLK